MVGWTALRDDRRRDASTWSAGRLRRARSRCPRNRVVVGDKAPGEVHRREPDPPAPSRCARRGAGRSRARRVRRRRRCARGDSHSDVFLVPTSRRGIIPIGPVRTVRADPIGLLRREVVWAESLDLFVHPRTIAIPSMSTGFVRDLEGAPTRDLTASDVAFHALREYVPGDERRNIHWKSTAKTGSYMVRQFEETRRSHLLVALSLVDVRLRDARRSSSSRSARPASLGVRAIRDSRTRLGRRERRSRPTSPSARCTRCGASARVNRGRLLDDLSGVETAQSALRIPELARIAAEGAAGISIAFLVCGSAVTPAQLRAASAALPARRRRGRRGVRHRRRPRAASGRRTQRAHHRLPRRPPEEPRQADGGLT